MNLDQNGSFTFHDLENHMTVKVNTLSQQKQYVERVNKWIQVSRNRFLEKGISFHLITMDGQMGETLRSFLKSRKRLMR
jgi:hypothetical protein